MPTRYIESSTAASNAWLQRVQMEGRAARNRVLLQQLDDQGLLSPEAPQRNYTRHGAQPALTFQGTTILPHLLSEADRKKLQALSEKLAAEQPPPTPSGSTFLQPNNTRASSTDLLPPPSRCSMRSGLSRVSHITMDSRLEKLEKLLEDEKQGRLEVQQELQSLKRLLQQQQQAPSEQPAKGLARRAVVAAQKSRTPTAN
eukprot:TRINITY_DN176_c0_g1_i1.p1 TRINITY_DN176_c0_g1~~TRINITY_DN176_c0_g1_i1.p1  ORF type:complete len:200 (+),score=33.03 TRINITY_DN176_c0_g1_i1:77-676(+)